VNRRVWLLAAAAVVAFVAGLQVASWWSLSAPPAGPATDLLQTVFRDADGAERRLSRWSGRTVLVNFWATWCAPCRREMPLFQAIQALHADSGLQVVGIALDNDQAVRRFRDELDIRFPLWLDQGPAGELMKRYGNQAAGLPFTLWLAPDGTVLGSKLGAYKDKELQAALQRYLPKPVSTKN